MVGPLRREPARLVVLAVVLVTAIGAVLVARHASHLGVAVVAAVLLLLAYGSIVGLVHNWRRNGEWPYNLVLASICCAGLVGLAWLSLV